MDEINIMKYKPSILIESDLFYEDEIVDTKSIISKYFNIEEIDPSRIQIPNLVGKEFRTSLNMARRMLVNTKPFDCSSWVPYLREYMISPETTQYNELGYLINNTYGHNFPMFIRPNNGHKTFSGQVFYSLKDFEKEYKWLKQQNVTDDLLCMYDTNPKLLNEEYRCVFIDHKFIDMSQYMKYGDKCVEHIHNNEVQILAEDIMKKLISSGFVLNIPNLVIDIAKIEDSWKRKYALIEINMFETASFYKCDLDKVYGEWYNQIIKSHE